MQKLCYYAQAWSYTLLGKYLFSATFQAWPHGPVNAELWNVFRDISYRDITIKDFKRLPIKTSPFSERDEALLERVWVTYGHLSGYQLEELSCGEMPWREQREGLSACQKSGKVIRRKTMEEFYGSRDAGD